MTHGGEYIPVYDARQAKIRGLWQRGSKYYARLKIAYPAEDHPKVRRVPLKGATVANARKELNALRVSSEKGQATVRERTLLLADYAPEYIRRIEEGNRKRARSGGERGEIIRVQTHPRPRFGFQHRPSSRSSLSSR